MLSCTVMCGCKVALLSLTENISLQPKFQLVEYFAGDAAVSKVFEEAGKAAFKYDEKYASRGLNVLTHGGFALLDCMFQAVSVCWKYMQYVFEPICCQLRCAICAALSSVPGALHLYAPVCSSWTLISSGTHERNGMNMFGNTSHEFVRDGTMMVTCLSFNAVCLHKQLHVCHILACQQHCHEGSRPCCWYRSLSMPSPSSSSLKVRWKHSVATLGSNGSATEWPMPLGNTARFGIHMHGSWLVLGTAVQFLPSNTVVPVLVAI